MPVTLKRSVLKYKKSNGQYADIDAITNGQSGGCDCLFKWVVDCTYIGRNNSYYITPNLPVEEYEWTIGECVLVKWPVSISLLQSTFVGFDSLEVIGLDDLKTAGASFTQGRYYILRYTEINDIGKFELVNISYPQVEEV